MISSIYVYDFGSKQVGGPQFFVKGVNEVVKQLTSSVFLYYINT